jgi:hypothetical protein
VESTHDYLVFALAMPCPRYVVRVLQRDAEKTGDLLAEIKESPFFGAEPSSSIPAESGPVRQRIPNRWNPAATTVEIGAGEDAGLARVLEDYLREDQIGSSRAGRELQTLHFLAMRADEAQAGEIVRGLWKPSCLHDATGG